MVSGNETLMTWGDPEIINPLRSTGKPFMLGPLLRMASNDFSDEEIALFASSHNGQRQHVKLARHVLRRHGLSAEILQLSPQLPIVPHLELDPPLSRGMLVDPLQNNCSGKHAALALLAQRLGQDPATYHLPGEPALSSVINHLESLANRVSSHFSVLVDGCGIPTFGLSLLGIARLYSEMASVHCTSPELGRVRNAYLRHPEAVGGACRASTAILASGLLAKEGFDGLFVLADPAVRGGCAVVIKIDSGSDIVAEAVALELAGALVGSELGSGVYPGLTITDQLGRHTGDILVESCLVSSLVDTWMRLR